MSGSDASSTPATIVAHSGNSRAAFTPDRCSKASTFNHFATALTDCRHELVEERGVSLRVPRAPASRTAISPAPPIDSRSLQQSFPARAATTHTLFCLRTVLPSDAQHVLCAILNSFVANYLVRLPRRHTRHCIARFTASGPHAHERHPVFLRLARLSRSLAESDAPVESMGEYAQLQASVARLYGLNQADFEHILGTFPLIPDDVKENVLREFRDPTR